MSPKTEPRTWFESTGSRYTYKIKTPDTYVIAAEVKAIGDDPLMFHKVRILDAETAEQIGDVLTTDEHGIVRALVPKNTKYRIELVEEEFEAHGAPVPDEIEPAVLRCEFTDESGVPLADRDVLVRFGDTDFTLITGDDGRIDVSAHLGSYELEIDDQVFEAHSVPGKDADKDESLYRFMIVSEASEQESEAGDPEERLARHDLPPDDEEFTA